MSSDRLSPAARDLIARRAAKAAGRLIPRRAGAAAPLSPAQLPHWIHAQREPGSPILHLPKRLRLRGRLDEAALGGALGTIAARHEALRSTVRMRDGLPEQVASPPAPVPLPVVDLRAVAPADRERQCAAQLDGDARRPFDLTRDLLMRPLLVRLADEEWVLQITFHHLVFDGWSTAVFLGELGAAYAGAALAPLPLQLGDVAAWEHARAGTAERAASVDWWRRRMEGAGSGLELGAGHPRPAAPTRAAGTATRTIDAGVTAALRALAVETRATLFAVVAAAWGLLVARRGGNPDPVLGIIVAGRHSAQLEPLIGNFMTTLPLRAPPLPGETFRARLERVQAAWLEGLAHGDVPILSHATEIFPSWGSAQGPLFPVLLNYRNMLARPLELAGLTADELETPVLGSTVDLHLNVTEAGGGLRCDLVYGADALDAAEAGRWLDGLATLLAALAADPDVPVDEAPILPDAERRLVLETWNAPRAPVPDAPAHAGLERHARGTPGAVAVALGDDELTYSELWTRARAVAAWLVAHGAGPGTRVGICAERSFELVAGVFGILEAGAAFVALDPQQPPARLGAMAAGAGLAALVTQPALEGRVAGWSGPTLSSPPPAPVAAPARRVAASDLAYVAFTSGSTGAPKACLVEHGSVVNLLEDRVRRHGLTADSRLLQLAALGFEGAFDLLLAAHAGCRLVLITAEEALAPAAVMAGQAVTHASFTPAVLAALPPAELPALRDLGIGGEAAPRELYLHWKRPGRRVWNEYGPTECTVWCSDEEVEDGHARVGIGRGVANTRLYVLDERGAPLPIGVTGELWVAGRPVGRGPLDERFQPDPFVPGERSYRTGDRARWLPRGSVELVGRVDRQLKIRGQRVEPAEIEQALGGHPNVRAVVVSSPDGALVAHYTTGDGRAIDAPALQHALRERLPPAMWPGAFVHLPALPLTPSGKIDARALPRPAPPASPADRSILAEPLHAMVAEVWRRLLPGRDFGPDDDFIDSGGHSLLAARMLHELARATGTELPLRLILTGATIRSLAWRIYERAFEHDAGDFVRVQEGDPARTPFFMFHGDLRGGAAYCRKMAQALGPAVPFYALAPPGPERAAECPSIEAVAALQLAALRRARPHGPYRLGGYCGAGLVAYEMAHRLQQAGERVDLLVLVDTRPWVLPGLHTDAVRRLIAWSTRDPARRAAREAAVLPRLEHLRTLPPAEALRYLIEGAGRVARRARAGRLASVLRHAPAAPVAAAPEDAAPEDAAPAAGVPDPAGLAWWLTLGGLRNRYVPPRVHGRVDLLWSAGFAPRAHAERWRAVVDELVITETPRSHLELVWHDLPAFVAAAFARLDGST